MSYHENRTARVLERATISIQGSDGHYSSPREYLEDINNYSSVEIALFDKDGKWLNPHTDELFKDFDLLDELLENYENGMHGVGGYVPLCVVISLINYLDNTDIKRL